MIQTADHLSELAPFASAIFNGEAIEQFGALCIRRRDPARLEVLLITTRQTRRWTIPKGWPIKGLAPHKVAEREAWEEAGVKGRAKKWPLGRFTYVKTLQDGTSLPAFVEVHLLEVKRMKHKFPERGERRLVWTTPAEALRMVDEPELRSMFRHLVV
jgi:8-oxo-dGTP pyrophosphatase MutT (NUDIX family)